jgi:hypothetical protein
VKTLRLLTSAVCLLCVATSAHALLGDNLDAITKHRGKKPDGKPDKNKAVWLFEGDDGQIAYAVRFDHTGRSIAETLKPALTGRTMHRDIIMDFIKAQLAPFQNSPSLLEPKAGEQYAFAGQSFTVAENEYVLVDAPNGILVVWVRGSLPSVTAITPAALQ